jgi:hypothetical protein
VLFRKGHTQSFQPFCHIGAFHVRAGNAEVGINQHFSDPGHADAADADEMNMLNATKHIKSGDG